MSQVSSVRPIDICRMLLLGAIWGSSFLFLKIVVPAVGPFATAGGRSLIGGLALLGVVLAVRENIEWRTNWRHYLVVGLTNFAMPFSLYAYASTKMPASQLAILNATVSLWVAGLSVLFFRERLGLRLFVGLLAGMAGVVLIVAGHDGGGSVELGLPVIAGVLAPVSYSIAALYMKHGGVTAKPRSVAATAQSMGGLILLPMMVLLAPVHHAPETSKVLLSLVALGLMCSGVGFMLYFRLMADIGAVRTSTVTFLVPFFGVLWASLFLRERLTPMMMLGSLLLFVAMGLVMFRTSELRPSRELATESAGCSGKE